MRTASNCRLPKLRPALDEDGKHRLGLGQPVLESSPEEGHDALGNAGQSIEARTALVPGRQASDRLDLGADPGQDARAVLIDARLVEPAETHASGEVADDREPQLGRHDQAIEHVARTVAEVTGGRRLVDPLLQQSRRDEDIGGGALLGQEDPEDRGLELG